MLEGNFLTDKGSLNGWPANRTTSAITSRRSVTSGPVADDTTRAIDRFFDTLDKGVDAATRVLDRSKYTEDQLKAHGKRREVREVIDVEPAPKSKAVSKETAVAKRPHFYIVESVDPKSGDTLFVVTDGGNARAECTTRELAAQILRALEKPSPPSSGSAP